jgi:hypothetical protein
MWATLFWLGFATMYAIHIWSVFQGRFAHAALGLLGATLMFVGSKLGREFLGIAA